MGLQIWRSWALISGFELITENWSCPNRAKDDRTHAIYSHIYCNVFGNQSCGVKRQLLLLCKDTDVQICGCVGIFWCLSISAVWLAVALSWLAGQWHWLHVMTAKHLLYKSEFRTLSPDIVKWWREIVIAPQPTQFCVGSALGFRFRGPLWLCFSVALKMSEQMAPAAAQVAQALGKEKLKVVLYTIPMMLHCSKVGSPWIMPKKSIVIYIYNNI